MNKKMNSEIITINPNRNLVLFNGKSCPFIICNSHVRNVFYILIKLVPTLFQNFETTFEIRANEYNYSFKIMGTCSINDIYTIIEHNKISTYKLVFLSHYSNLKTNPTVYINELYKCKYTIKSNIYTLLYNPLSFRQPDDNIQEHINNKLMDLIVNIDNIVFIGGDMTLFGKFLNYKKGLFLTDMVSIHDDALQNLSIDNINKVCKLVNYDKDDIKTIINSFMWDVKYCIICNTGVSGLGEHLALEINKTLSNFIIIISCSIKSFNKDRNNLCKGGIYLQNEIIIRSNYDIGIYKLS